VREGEAVPAVFEFRPGIDAVVPTEAQVSGRAGCRSADLGDVRGAVERASCTAVGLAEPRAFELSLEARFEGDLIVMPGIILSSGPLVRALEGAAEVSLMLSTIGPACEDEADALEMSGDHLGAFLLDAAASVLVENVMKELHRETAGRLPGRRGTVRFSPGFGDFSLESQADIVRLLGGDSTGVRVMEESYTLVPRKSMTGVTGWVPLSS
jgi:hypothetical protein